MHKIVTIQKWTISYYTEIRVKRCRDKILKKNIEPKASKGYLRNVRCIKGGLLRKGGCLANADIGPKKQHFHWKTK